jgi:hypothetical protein
VKLRAALKSARRSPDHLVMDEQRDKEKPLAKLDEELCGPRSAEDKKILRWRFRELRGLGLSHVEARMLAETGADIALIRRLIGDGCPPTLALKIAL